MMEAAQIERAPDAASRLTHAGLVHRHDEFVFPTHAARRAAEPEITA
jgi:hypothetical protein